MPRLRLLLAILLAAAPARAQSADSVGRLSMGSCPDSTLGRADCGTYTVWENRETRRGRSIALRIVRLRATGDPRPDAIFFLAGGPGQGAAELAPVFVERFERLRRRHDIVFVDQRGTGASNPLQCDPPAGADTLHWLLGPNFDLATIRECRARLEARADLLRYATPPAMDDLDDVRRAMGYPTIDLVGGSYGTRAALVYARQHPAHVRTIVLQSVASVDMRLPLTFARDAQLAFAGLVKDCRADSACAAAFPDPAADLDTVLARLARAPARLTMAQPGGPPLDVTVERGWFAETIRYGLYGADVAANVPSMLHRAAAGDFRPTVRFGIQNRFGLWQQLSLGVLLTVTCAEDVPFIRDGDVARWTAHTFLGDYRIAQQRRACEEWPRAPLPPRYREPVRTEAPTLLVSGEYDPATSPLIASDVARRLPQSRVVVVPHGGHSPGGLVNADCVERIEDAFIEAGTVDGLDTTCLPLVRRPPFLVGSQAAGAGGR